ncbi:acyl carrier protein, partial [Ruminococcus flavefaciens]|uniref:acyl carrier protein n=1 Tax=Ruminococcus flavefaciens TaxID=1265 RepID=UPI00055B71DB
MIVKELQDIFIDVFEDNSIIITPDFALEDIEEWDSLEFISIIEEIKDVFNVGIGIHDLANCEYVKDLIDLIENSSEDDKEKYLTLEHSDFEKRNAASSVQERLYALYCSEPSRLDYNITLSVKINGVVDIDQLKKAYNKCISLNPMLRARFYHDNDGLFYFIKDFVSTSIDYKDLSVDGESFDMIKERELKSFSKPFDLDSDELLTRAEIVKCSDDTFLLLLAFHHIVFDGRSVAVFMKQFGEFYNKNEVTDCLSEYQYCDFVRWQKEYINSVEYKAKTEFWKETVDDNSSSLDLLKDNPYVKENLMNNVRFERSILCADEINNFCKAKKCTRNTFFVSALFLVLNKLTSEKDITIGTFVAGRKFNELSNTVGMYVNTVPVKKQIDTNINLGDFVSEMQTSYYEVLDNSDVLYETIYDVCGVKNELYNVAFRYQKSYRDLLTIDGASCQIKGETPLHCSNDLSVYVNELADSFELIIQYAEDIYTHEKIEKIADSYCRLIDDILHNPDSIIKDISLITDSEKQLILNDFNATETDYPREKTVAELFEEQVKKTPDNVALVFEDKELTYAELNAKANSLAHKLREMGVKPDDFVAIIADRSIEMIAGIYGIIKAGGAYV